MDKLIPASTYESLSTLASRQRILLNTRQNKIKHMLIIHSTIRLIFEALNRFMTKRFTINSKNFISELLSAFATRPYKIGIHLYCKSWNFFRSYSMPTFPKGVLAALEHALLAWVRDNSNIHEKIINVLR